MEMASASYLGHGSPQISAGTPAFDDQGDETADIPRRLMRVKVLYTFDDLNKSNCLARLPNALNIPTVALDETTQIGVIELKTCIQAIVAASPELVAKLGHDYTVYAYDFSEYETPLVGQGMLSWILASSSSTPSAPAEQSQTMVTGRVCKNILGLFSNGIKETLEVKLKLVPVPTCLQSEYVENMEKYRSLSKIMPEGFDYSAWTDFLKANPAIGQLAQQKSQSPFKDQSRGIESIHRMLTRSASEDDMRGDGYPQNRFREPFDAQESRGPSPAPSVQSCTALQQITRDSDSRPASRASFSNERPTQSRHHSFDMGSLQETNDEGPTRKRARITKATRPGKSVLGAKNDSLRVTASTAASVRSNRPILANQSTSGTAPPEAPPRAPTPRPDRRASEQDHGRARRIGGSSLRHGSTHDSQQSYVSPYNQSDNAAESTDDERGGSAGETPMEFPSSPPLMPQPFQSPVPSSPGLPMLTYPVDSGFASDTVLERDVQGSMNTVLAPSAPSLPATVRQRAPPNRAHRPWTEVAPGDMDLLPKTTRPLDGPDTLEATGPTSQSVDSQVDGNGPSALSPPAGAPASSTAMDSRSRTAPMPKSEAMPIDVALTPSASGDNLPTQPPIARSTTPRPMVPRRRTGAKSKGLPRSQTWSGETGQEFFSDAATGPIEDEGEINQSQPRSGSGARRKGVIKEQLAESIAQGMMPKFCRNCGEIDTSTWRRAYSRIEIGDPPVIAVTPEEGGVVGFESVKDAEGNELPNHYRVFVQYVTAPDERYGYEVLSLCNPCGLWFYKKGTMRPREIWDKSLPKPPPPPPAKRKRNRAGEYASRKKKREMRREGSMGIQEPSSSAFPYSDAPFPETEAASQQYENGSQQLQAAETDRPRASSIQGSVNGAKNQSPVEDSAAAVALRRAIQSSPARFLGTKHSPINIEQDLTPKPTRRLLFPSPRSKGEKKSLGDIAESSPLKSDAATPRATAQETQQAGAVDDLEDGNDKENCPPPLGEEDDLAHLFEDADLTTLQTTPSKNGPSFSDLLKTPTPTKSNRHVLTPKAFAGSNQEGINLLKTPTRSVRGATAPLTPFTAQLNALLGSEGMNVSPSHFDFSNFSLLNTPRGSSGLQFSDFTADDFLSSDLPLPSSPPANMFTLYEDPATSTVGLWSGTSIFDASDPAGPVQIETQHDGHKATKTDTGVDFATIIEEVVSAKEKIEGEKGAEKVQSPASGQKSTPSAPAT